MTAALQEEAFGAQKELAKLRTELALAKSASLASEAVQLDSGARMLVARLDGAENKSLQVLLACYPSEAHAGPHLLEMLVISSQDTVMCDAGRQSQCTMVVAFISGGACLLSFRDALLCAAAY